MSQLQEFRAKLIDAVGQFAALVADSAKEDIQLSDEDRLLEVRTLPLNSSCSYASLDDGMTVAILAENRV
ncbi:hypothetical protein AMAG_20640 [Allomyces macrogynus ATCC 38327]|uniref:Uncharacterized protein n=1 Tax=Allomyces macrogynus (strain ATCC 38327) TaxID=578462 RepID=A0A0L0TE43_ALLM3|nr:hypothetical protein AMAG_20640 [Allomyces macrogynus ATCC 38327]|eukprot:KNE72946.1 hypothetical protein AMAG_20640 [Allomyces macrogynus ATCC 38327]